MSTHRLTGRTRYRMHKSLFSPYVVVLQVQERRDPCPLDTYMAGDYWRDARMEDMVELAERVALDARGAPATQPPFFRATD